MNVGEIIDEIAPYYNQYKHSKKNISGAESIGIMWEIGSILEKHINKLGISPDSLFREIYGKSEGKKNTVQKSYIAREFQQRCYRIKKIFLHKDDIKKQFPTLVTFSAFRTAMPFFYDGKYKLNGDEREKLLFVLNNSKSGTEALSYVNELREKYIGIKNPRNQRAGEANLDLFKSFYSNLKELLEKDYNSISEKLSSLNISKDIIKDLSKNIMSMADDSFMMKTMENGGIADDIWNGIIEFVNKVAKESTPKLRRRVRKNVSARGLLQLSRMLTALTSEEYYRNYRNNFQ